MADFQSSLLAQEIEEVLTGAVTFQPTQTLSETQKMIVREKIGAATTGTELRILSHYDTLQALSAAVTDPKGGDAYSVGTTLPYSLYIYDTARNGWVDYGSIRAIDISGRAASNLSVNVSDWVEDDSLYPGYTYRARVPVDEVTTNDFPIVVFAPADAAAQIYSPVAFALDGYVEIWANRIPTASIVIPTVTFIVGIGTNKGYTNASAGISANSITAEMIVTGAVTETFTATIGTEWTGEAAPYTQTIAVNGLLASDNPIIDIVPDNDYETAESQLEAWGSIYRITTAANSITVYSTEETETEISIQIKAVRK